MAPVPWNQVGDTTKLYGGQGPLNSSFAPAGGRILRACSRKLSTHDFGVRKYSETRRPCADEDASVLCSA